MVRFLANVIQEEWHVDESDQLILSDSGNIADETDSLIKYSPHQVCQVFFAPGVSGILRTRCVRKPYMRLSALSYWQFKCIRSLLQLIIHKGEITNRVISCYL